MWYWGDGSIMSIKFLLYKHGNQSSEFTSTPSPHIYTHTNTQAHFSVQNAFACNSKTGRVDTGESPRLINSLIESVVPRFTKRLWLKIKVQSN